MNKNERNECSFSFSGAYTRLRGDLYIFSSDEVRSVSSSRDYEPLHTNGPRFWQEPKWYYPTSQLQRI